MTLEELKQIESILNWVKGNVVTPVLLNRTYDSLRVVQREIRLKTHDFVKDKTIRGMK